MSLYVNASHSSTGFLLVVGTSVYTNAEWGHDSRTNLGLPKLELSFETEKIRDVCESRAKALSMLGATASIELHKRLADIEAVGNVAELSALFPGLVVDRSEGTRALIFMEGHHLLFKSGHVTTPRTAAGVIDWGQVSRIRLATIEAIK